MEYRDVWTPEYLVVPDIVNALDHLYECLEELSITQPNDLNDMDKPLDDQPIASLAEFKVLKKIEVSANILLGRPGYAGKNLDPITFPVEQEQEIKPLLVTKASAILGRR